MAPDKQNSLKNKSLNRSIDRSLGRSIDRLVVRSFCGHSAVYREIEQTGDVGLQETSCNM